MRRERIGPERGRKAVLVGSALARSPTVGRNTAPAVSALPPSLAVARAVLARRVRVLRAVKGWSQETLAEISGLHRTYVSTIERQRCNVSLESLLKLAGAFEVSVGELLDGRGAVEIGEFPLPPTRGEGS